MSRGCCRCCFITRITSACIICSTTHGIYYTLIWCTSFTWFLSWRINITCNTTNKCRLLCKLKQTWIWIMILTTTGITSRAGTANLSGASELIPGLGVVRIAWMLVFCVMFCGSLFVYSFCLPLNSVIDVLLWFMDSDYTFGIFKHFFRNKMAINKGGGIYIVKLVGFKTIIFVQ